MKRLFWFYGVYNLFLTSARTLQRWRTTKPELYAIIEAGFKLYEMIESEEEITKDIKNMLKESLKKR